MTCPQCLHAQQLVTWQHYAENCYGCEVRKLAGMDFEKRQKQLDLVAHLCGPAARAEVVKLLSIERARVYRLVELKRRHA